MALARAVRPRKNASPSSSVILSMWWARTPGWPRPAAGCGSGARLKAGWWPDSRGCRSGRAGRPGSSPGPAAAAQRGAGQDRRGGAGRPGRRAVTGARAVAGPRAVALHRRHEGAQAGLAGVADLPDGLRGSPGFPRGRGLRAIMATSGPWLAAQPTSPAPGRWPWSALQGRVRRHEQAPSPSRSHQCGHLAPLAVEYRTDRRPVPRAARLRSTRASPHTGAGRSPTAR